jgi:hypothetical protein
MSGFGSECILAVLAFFNKEKIPARLISRHVVSAVENCHGQTRSMIEGREEKPT